MRWIVGMLASAFGVGAGMMGGFWMFPPGDVACEAREVVVPEVREPPAIELGPCFTRVDADPATWSTGGEQLGPFRRCGERVTIADAQAALPGFTVEACSAESVGERILYARRGGEISITVFNVSTPSLVIHDAAIPTWGGIRVGDRLGKVRALIGTLDCSGDSLACSYGGDDDTAGARHWTYVLEEEALSSRERERVKRGSSLPAWRLDQLPIAAIGWDP